MVLQLCFNVLKRLYTWYNGSPLIEIISCFLGKGKKSGVSEESNRDKVRLILQKKKTGDENQTFIDLS
jgi:hypothetical protein